MNGLEIFKSLVDKKSLYEWAIPPSEKCEESSLKMTNHYHPFSIKHDEFDFIYDVIVKNNLKCGYEVATAFGISALAAGLAFKKTGGKIVTMDAYVEEHFNHCAAYRDLKKFELNAEPDGLKSVKYLIKKFKLKYNLFPEVGWSPNDTKKCLEKHFNFKKQNLDYIFIDAGHWDEAAISDIDSVSNFISDNCFIFLHDVHCFTDKFLNHLKITLNRKIEIVVPHPRGFNLGQAIKI